MQGSQDWIFKWESTPWNFYKFKKFWRDFSSIYVIICMLGWCNCASEYAGVVKLRFWACWGGEIALLNILELQNCASEHVGVVKLRFWACWDGKTFFCCVLSIFFFLKKKAHLETKQSCEPWAGVVNKTSCSTNWWQGFLNKNLTGWLVGVSCITYALIWKIFLERACACAPETRARRAWVFGEARNTMVITCELSWSRNMYKGTRLFKDDTK